MNRSSDSRHRVICDNKNVCMWRRARPNTNAFDIWWDPCLPFSYLCRTVGACMTSKLVLTGRGKRENDLFVSAKVGRFISSEGFEITRKLYICATYYNNNCLKIYSANWYNFTEKGNETKTKRYLIDPNEEHLVQSKREHLMNLRRLFVSKMHFNYTAGRIGF